MTSQKVIVTTAQVANQPHMIQVSKKGKSKAWHLLEILSTIDFYADFQHST